MASALPAGDPAPLTGQLPAAALGMLSHRPFGIYLHVPFCSTRCGYCDFNTYTAAELGGEPGASRIGFADTAVAELDLAVGVLTPQAPPVSTIFVGGGTPTLLPAVDLARMVEAVCDRFGLQPDAEITTEANPESVTAADLEQLVEGGFSRISFGMQSAVPHVLATLDRVHSPGRPLWAAGAAKRAGFSSVSLDLIYGTPGESLHDWRRSLDAALSAEPDHVSAYALIIEDGTRLSARIRRGELPAPDDDDLADKYVLAEEVLSSSGYAAYEVSNWARGSEHWCRHNLGYWRGHNWWGVGPGAHSHVGGVRWWNVKHPARYAARLAAGESPAQGREVLSESDRQLERVMLEIRLSGGLDLAALSVDARSRLPDLEARHLIVLDQDRLRLTLNGRLLADAVVRDLVP
jgi:putative oxygen-independent coproporphyrinogen III oxidase